MTAIVMSAMQGQSAFVLDATNRHPTEQSVRSNQIQPHDEQINRGQSEPEDRSGGPCFMYARILSRFWYVICLLVFLASAAFAVVVFTLYDLPDFTDPSKGYQPRGTDIASRVFSFQNLLHDSEDLLVDHPSRVVNSQSSNMTQTPVGWCWLTKETEEDKKNLEPAPGIQFCNSIWDWDDTVATLVLESVDGNILTPEALKSSCKAEERYVTSHPAYQDHCLCRGNHTDSDCPSVWSIGNYIALLSNKSSCADIEEEDISRTVDLCKLCAPFLYNVSGADLLKSNISDDFPCECAEHNFAIHTVLYYLLPTEFSLNIIRNTNPLISPFTLVFFPISGRSERVALDTIYVENIENKPDSDGVTKLKAVEFFIKFEVFPRLLYSDSLYLGIAGAAIFLLIWVYCGSILVTSAAVVNAVLSLVLAYFLYTSIFQRPFFPFGNVVTAVLIIGIGADDTFVFMDLWKKFKSELGDQDLPRLLHKTLRHTAATMSVTSLTTASALYTTAVSDIPFVKCFAVFAGTAIVMNLVLTMTLLPAVIVMQHKLTIWCCSSLTCKPKRDIKEMIFERLNVFHQNLVPFLVLKLRWIWIILFLSLMAGSVVVVFLYPTLRLPATPIFQIFASSHPFEQFDFIYRDQMSYLKSKFPDHVGSIVWGVQAADNGDTWNPDDLGTLSLDESFQLSDPEDQTWLLDFCRDLQSQPFYRAGQATGCFIEDFISFMKSPDCANPLIGFNLSPCCNQSGFPYEPALFTSCVAKYTNAGFLPTVFLRNKDSEIAVLTVPFQTTYPSSFNYDTSNEFWTTVDAWVREKVDSAPVSLQRGWFVSDSIAIRFYDLQESLRKGVPVAMLLTLATASLILFLTTRNILLTLWAMLTITSTVFVVVAILVLLGWELNVVEATIITLAVGLSIDFTIHYGVAYKLSPLKTRRQRARYSLTTMTPPISMAALSSFLAGALVLPARVLAYYQIGLFLMLVMVVSWVYGTFFFQSLCTVAGPQNFCGDVPYPEVSQKFPQSDQDLGKDVEAGCGLQTSNNTLPPTKGIFTITPVE
ncbi:protein dispatched homolog 1-like [Patiria miniata]|uniref:SSD domain-containing protein n=1 Tax=Patiria miniata TaxID=46514 RepID=A0A913ZS84_PATMI|nr:protein dispatched homolog 1-like [Patiria miniata]